jgi:hypothetical protein
MTDTAPTRKHPRVKAPDGMLVAWQVGTQRYVSRLDNVALGGLYIRTPNPAPAESVVKVVVSMPAGGVEVQARGVVRRVIPSRGMGIEFTAMNQEDRGRLSGLLKPLIDQQPIETERRV